MLRHLACSAAAAALLAAVVPCQQAPANGPRSVHPDWHALTHARVVVRPGTVLDDATIVVRDGKILSVTVKGPVPTGARTWDCEGSTVYPGFVEAYCPVPAPAPDPKASGTHWNPKITPQRHALQGEGLPTADRESLRKLGFGAVAVAPAGGIFAGRAAVVLTGKPHPGQGERVVLDRAYQALAFDRSGGYPGSEMGVMAAMRQALHDTGWHAMVTGQFVANPDRHRRPEQADAPAALAADRNKPLLFDCQDELQLLRAHRIATEFKRRAIALGSGLEFRRIGAVAATGMPVLVPVDFPAAPDVATVAKAERISLRQLMTWEQAPTNPARLNLAKVQTAFTTARLKDRKEFFVGIRRALEHGLTKDEALAMLTTGPAKILGVDRELGQVRAGFLANLVVVDGELFDEKAKIRRVWVEGRPFLISRKKHDLDGIWTLALSGRNQSVRIQVKESSVTAKLEDETIAATKVKREDRHLSFLLPGKVLGVEGMIAFGGHAESRGLFGRGFLPGGQLFQFVATRTGDLPDDADKPKDEKTAEIAQAKAGTPAGKTAAAGASEKPEKKTETVALEPLPVPFGAYGLDQLPPRQDLLVLGATVWTSDKAGILENGALWVRDGKVAWVGKADALPSGIPGSTTRIDAQGKHLTPGLIDCHSHTGISRGINESRQAVTSEVRVADVVNPDDIAWYRELAGGLTAVNQLHGSANPIGGQNHVAKIRWGVPHPDAMSLQGAPGGIKFALGENPKRAGSRGRYPGSRHGVAALIRARFLAAREYDARMRKYAALAPGQRWKEPAPRRDLELEALAEILRGERLIHCHSYRQDEIFMLCQLADEFGFKLGTLQHVLEGYKVAEAIKRSALGASSFSDWWAYKLEVIDAIPFNGAIMHEAGVVVSFNSDSSELARRMNTEAGKAVKYGGVPPAEALKFVTLNPAIQLGVQDRIGSLAVGKDADFAIWSGDPLSYRSRCEATYIDGRAHFTLERDRVLRARASKERRRLLQKALRADKVAKDQTRGNRYAYVDALYSCCDRQGGAR